MKREEDRYVKRLLPLVAGVALLALAFGLLWPSDESRIRKLLKTSATAVETRDIERFMAPISFAYQDDFGLSFLTLKELAKRELATLSDISIEFEITALTVHKDSASATAAIRMIATRGTETGYFLGDVKAPFILTVALAKERGKWMIVGASADPPSSQGRHSIFGVSWSMIQA